MNDHYSPRTKAVEVRCVECGELVRLKTPTYGREQALALLVQLVDGTKSGCHDSPMTGTLLGYDRQSAKVFDVTDEIVEIGPSRAERLMDPRTDEWSESDPTPVEIPRERTNKNVVSRDTVVARKRGEKGQL